MFTHASFFFLIPPYLGTLRTAAFGPSWRQRGGGRSWWTQVVGLCRLQPYINGWQAWTFILLVLRVVYLDSGNVSIQETTVFSHNLNGKWICSTNALSVQPIFFAMFFLRFFFQLWVSDFNLPRGDLLFRPYLQDVLLFQWPEKHIPAIEHQMNFWIHCTIEFLIWMSCMNVLAECVFEFWHFPYRWREST